MSAEKRMCERDVMVKIIQMTDAMRKFLIESKYLNTDYDALSADQKSIFENNLNKIFRREIERHYSITKHC
jgi:hypothetical protein